MKNWITYLAFILMLGIVVQPGRAQHEMEFEAWPESFVITPTISQPTGMGVCDGSISLSVTQGASPYTFIWSTGDTSNFIGNLCPGVYSVVIIDNNGQGDSTSYVLQANTIPMNFSFVSQNASCNGYNDGYAYVSGSPVFNPFTFIWSNGSTTMFSDSLTAGNYVVTVSSIQGGDSIINFEITEPDPITANFIYNGVDPVTETGGSILANATGGMAPYQYLWSNSLNNPLLNDASYGNYEVQVIDNNGCSQYFDNLFVDFSILPDWTFKNNSDSSGHVVDFSLTQAIEIYGVSVSKNDFIGAFYDSSGTEACGGYLIWENNNATISLNEDLGGTIDAEGFITGEEIKWRIWDASENEVFDAIAYYNPSYNNGAFSTSSLSYIDSLQVFELGGRAYSSPDIPMYGGYALLYQKIEEQYFPLAQRELDQGYFTFQGIPSGRYLVQVYPENSSDNLLPVYSGNDIHWEPVSAIICQGKTSGVDITLKEKPFTAFGIGKIAGHVAVGSDVTYDPDFNQIIVYLFNQDDMVIDYRLCNYSGQFSFDDLPLGTYFLRVEKPGLHADSTMVILSASTTTVNYIQFELSNGQVLGDDTQAVSLDFQLYPNPAQEVLNISFDNNAYSGTINLYTANGRLVKTKYMNMQQEINFDLNDLSSGAYYLQIENNELWLREKVIIIK